MPSFIAMTDWTVPTTALMSIGLAFPVVLIYRVQRRKVRETRYGCRRMLAWADVHCADPEPAPEPDSDEPGEQSTFEENR